MDGANLRQISLSANAWQTELSLPSSFVQKPLRCARLKICFFFIGFLGSFCEHRLASCSRILNLLFSQSSSRLSINALTSRVVFIIGSRCKFNRLNTRSRSEHSFWFNRQTSFVKRSTYLRPMLPHGTNYSLPWMFTLTVHLFPNSVS